MGEKQPKDVSGQGQQRNLLDIRLSRRRLLELSAGFAGLGTLSALAAQCGADQGTLNKLAAQGTEVSGQQTQVAGQGEQVKNLQTQVANGDATREAAKEPVLSGKTVTTEPTTIIEPKSTVTETEILTPTETQVPASSGEFDLGSLPAFSNSASKVGSEWVLHDSDMNEIKTGLIEGFTPDKDLKVSTIKPKSLGDIQALSEFQAALNEPVDGFPPLAGFTNSINDYNQYADHKSGPQVPAFSWEVHTGLFVEMPGIGRVEGEPGTAVEVLIINRDETVYRFPTNSVTVIAGFQGWGRIWDGEKNIDETERRLTGHFVNRLGYGVPEKGFIGQCDQGEENCSKVRTVSVERLQWGNNPDGSPRFQFRLIRNELVDAKTGQTLK